MVMRCVLLVLLGVAGAGAGPGCWARDVPEPAPHHVGPAAVRWEDVRSHLAAERWQDALDALQRWPALQDADWHNLMGYALRRRSPPDLAAAEHHYEAALSLDPLHRGALEYAGELHLVNGRPDLAERRLAQLARACAGPCEEHADLARAIARYKAERAVSPGAR